jgi:hypothetical protein
LLRQSVYSRLAGYEDTNDAERLSVDPAMRLVVGERAKDKAAASVSQMGRFETEILTQPAKLKALISQPGKWVDEVHQRKSIKKLSSTWTVQTARHLASKKVLLTMGISVIPVITPCSCSISLGIWSVPYFAMAMSIVPMTGKVYWNPSLNGIEIKTSHVISVEMLLLLIPIFTACLKPKGIVMRYG